MRRSKKVVLVVVAVWLVLVAIIVFAAWAFKQPRSKRRQVEFIADTLVDELAPGGEVPEYSELSRIVLDRCPPSIDLQSFSGRMLDGWDQEFRITCRSEGSSVTVTCTSAGSDRMFGTLDDLSHTSRRVVH